MAEIDKLETDLKKQISEADADLKVINQPGVTAAQRAEILARRNKAKDHVATPAYVEVKQEFLKKVEEFKKAQRKFDEGAEIA